MFIGIDVGGTKTAVLIASEHGEILAQVTQPTEKGDLVSGVIEAIETAVSQTDQPVTDLRAIGIGVPGLVDPENGDVCLAVNLGISEPLALGRALEATFGVPVVLENDVRLGAMGAYQQLNIKNLAYLSLGTGVAAGVVLDGRVYRGVNGLAGEIGFVQVNENGDDVLETLISGPAIMQQAAEQGLDVAHAGEVYELALSGNGPATAVIERVSRLVALAIQWVVLAYDVEAVVLGGGVTASRRAFLDPILDQLAHLRSRSTLNAVMLTANKVKLLPPGFNAGLWGGVHVARQVVEKNAQSIAL